MEQGDNIRDCTTRKNKDTHDGNVKTHLGQPGILFKEEKEHGTRITSTNVAGSLTDSEYMLDHCKDHIMLLQEHWRLESDISVWKAIACNKG